MDLYNHWLTTYMDEIIRRNTSPIILNTGKTTSGKIHIGILRELVICDALQRLLEQEAYKSKFLFFIDDFDSAKQFPEYVPKDYEKYLGMPFSDIPDPFSCHESYGEHFAREFLESSTEFYIQPELVWTHKLYQSAKMKQAIRTALQKVNIIREIYMEFIGPTLDPKQRVEYQEQLTTWMPAIIVCTKCNHLLKIGKPNIPNRIVAYDSENDTVEYHCPNCGNQETILLGKARVKLTWRVDWPAKWKIYQVDCEPAGKDHAVKGGAFDTGLAISKRIFDYDGPVKIPYEWVRFGLRDMKTHKGIVFTPDEYLKMGLSDALRYVLLRTDPNKAISIRPEFFPQVLDEFIILEEQYYQDTSESPELALAKFLYPLCIKDKPAASKPNRLPYRFAVIIAQLDQIMDSKKIQEKSQMVYKQYNNLDTLSKQDKKQITNVIGLAKYWVTQYAPERVKITVDKKVSKDVKQQLTDQQRRALLLLADQLEKIEYTQEQQLQNEIFKIGKRIGDAKPKALFQAFYLALIGKPYGPRLAPFILSLDLKWVTKRFREAAE